MMRVMVGMHASPAQTLVGALLGALPLLLIAFMTILILARSRKARTHLLLVLPVTIGMIVLCISCGIWLRTLWPLLPQISQFYPQASAALLAGLTGTGLATVLALGSLVRAAFALRALSAASPKQESGQGQALPLPYTDQLAPAVHGRGDPCGRPGSVPKGWVVLLVVLLLLFVLPWPLFLPFEGPDFGALLVTLVTWCLAGVVGLIAAWLVKPVGKKQAEHASRKLRRATSPLVWAALLPIPFLISTLQVARYTLFDVSLPLPVRLGYLLAYLLPAGLVSSMTILIVKIRCRWPRLGTALKVWRIYLLIPICIFMFTQFGSMLPGLHFLDGLFIPLYVTIAICIIPALIVKLRSSNEQSDHVAQEPRNAVSPKVWIIVIPVLFLAFCMQAEYIFLPDYPGFGEVLLAWFQTGLASLIILLALKLGSRASTRLPTQEALQQVQVQG